MKIEGLTNGERELLFAVRTAHQNKQRTPRLKEFERLVVKLVKRRNISPGDVAELFGITVGRVNGIVRRKGFLSEFL
ncbi:transposase family protein [Streptomyces griseosporeus]|uniref:transposase family protein n=1 Tax=Streptomyces griseosporeus TaxID=1910 RepID=UPI00167E024B|nr:transposase family protein [Streptomyces griseosporeus]GHF92329.1 hypothetical protein GCM10018783_74020 [Streptomyces griseosporeus]